MPFPVFQPGRNVWRIERARRAAVLVDGAAFFGALRRAFIKAERSIFIVGWDIDSRTRLVGEDCEPQDGYSPILAEFLSELVETKPGLQVYVLLWDFSVIYTAEREMFPRLSLQWKTPARVTLCMDDAVPFGSSQHQKLFLVDDALAFSGGLDLTQRRWDTAGHNPDDPDRVDTEGRPYPPFHDVQMMVDGEAARALAELARSRWGNAHGTEPPIVPCGDPWPTDIRPDFTNVDIGIARTQPEFGAQKPVHEVRTLFLDSIDRAERTIYVENQFLTSRLIARRMARRLRARPDLEILAIAPRGYRSKVVSSTLGDERIRFFSILKRAGGERVRLLYPSITTAGTSIATMVHSKVMIVDDKFLRVGSANLNNRSMGTDTECDLAIEAQCEQESKAINGIRSRLLADHCGTSIEAAEKEMTRCRSLIAAAHRLSANGHSLRAIDDGEPNKSPALDVVKQLIDPQKPLATTPLWKRIRARLPESGSATAVLVLLFVVTALTVIWHFTPVAGYVTRENMQSILSTVKESAWAPLWVLVAYVVAGAIAFPIVVLIVATAATFGAWLGFVYATLGALASALLMYAIGTLAGPGILHSIAGSRLDKVRLEIENRGVLAVALIRLVPLAPFTVVNLAAGAFSISLFDYIAGTLIGMLPGLIAISLLGERITTLATDFSVTNVTLLLLLIVAWSAIAWSIQALAHRFRKRPA